MAFDIANAFASTFRAFTGIDALVRIKRELVLDKDEALKELVKVLEEIKKTFYAFEEVLQDYLSLWFDTKIMDARTIADFRRTLVALEGGSIRVQIAEARGHCGRITDIYDECLTPWFGRFFEKNKEWQHEKKSIDELFVQLRDTDAAVIYDIEALSSYLEDRSTEVLEDLDKPDVTSAQRRLAEDRNGFRHARQQISEYMAKLVDLKWAFSNV